MLDIKAEYISFRSCGQESGAPGSTGAKLSLSRTLRPQPSLGVRAAQLSVSHDGAYAAAAGTSPEVTHAMPACFKTGVFYAVETLMSI